MHVYTYLRTLFFFVHSAIYTFLPHNSIIRHCNFCFKGMCVLKTATSICIALSTTFHVGRVFFKRAVTDLKRRINDIDNRRSFHVVCPRVQPNDLEVGMIGKLWITKNERMVYKNKNIWGNLDGQTVCVYYANGSLYKFVLVVFL